MSEVKAPFTLITTQAMTFNSLEELKRGARAYLKQDKTVSPDMIEHLVHTGEVYAVLGSHLLKEALKRDIPAVEIALSINCMELQPNGEYTAIPLGAPPEGAPAELQPK